MRANNRLIVVGLLSATFIAPVGCDTTTGALSGGAIGAGAGAIIDRKNPLVGALIGGAAGAIAGGIIGRINEEQRQKLQAQSPQTWQTIQHNDQVAAAQNTSNTPAPSSPGTPAGTPTAPPPPAPSGTSTPPAAASAKPVPLGVDDIKAMASSGIKKDVICDEIKQSQATYTPQDIAAAQQSTPTIDPAVIDCMKEHQST